MNNYSVSMTIVCEMPLDKTKAVANAEVDFEVVIKASDILDAANKAKNIFITSSPKWNLFEVTRLDVVMELGRIQ